MSDLRDAFSVNNLQRAWRRLNTNPDRYYKNYFRHIYRAYAISAVENLADLRQRLVQGSYSPANATKVYIPKPSGLQRLYSLLTVEDQIMYQAFANIIADRLYPVVRRRYNKEVFGHLYAGPRSIYFYKDWRIGYKKFNRAIMAAFRKGFHFAASFDLTACYDSIDHNVLSHFLLELDLDQEFVTSLCDSLQHWTATHSDNPIHQGHGIPQGPLSSGLLSEVVLRHFDENRPTKQNAWCYFRFVDDIRFYARDEYDLRALLIEMDLLSKQIGLFPQNSKIGIHRVTNIEEEVKLISSLHDPVIRGPDSDQGKVIQRLVALSPRHKIDDETKFKYQLGGAQPNAALSNRLIAILDKQPHLYSSIFNYFRRAPIPRQISITLLELLTRYELYPAFTAAGLRAMHVQCHPEIRVLLNELASRLIQSQRAMANAELRAAIKSVLLSSRSLIWQDIQDYVKGENDWWARSELIQHVPIEQIGEPSYSALINELITDSSVDVSLVAAEALADRALAVEGTITNINLVAQLALIKLGLISGRRGRRQPISHEMHTMLGKKMLEIDWRRILGRHYQANISKVTLLRTYSESDPNSWINLLNAFHDDLLDSLCRHEAGSVETYQYTRIGAYLGTPKPRFSAKYPIAWKAFVEINKVRAKSPLSHSTIRATGRRTRYIKFRDIEKMKSILVSAYLEIWRKW